MEDIIITNHAIERFTERFAKFSKTPLNNPEATIRKLLAKAEPEEINPVHRVKRLITNGFQESNYLIRGEWRFVLTGNVLLTVEFTNPNKKLNGGFYEHLNQVIRRQEDNNLSRPLAHLHALPIQSDIGLADDDPNHVRWRGHNAGERGCGGVDNQENILRGRKATCIRPVIVAELVRAALIALGLV